MIINFKRINENVKKIPTRGSKYAAGYDLYAFEPDKTIEIHPTMSAMIHTGISVEIPDGHFGAIFARSGLATKNGLRPSNCVGIVDADYRGEIMVSLHNDSNLLQKIQHGDRIAQLVIMPYSSVEFVEVNELSTTDRGKGGFGSTGTN